MMPPVAAWVEQAGVLRRSIWHRDISSI